MDVSVYLDRAALKEAVLTLLIPPAAPELRTTVKATGTEINGEPDNPASLERAHRYADERGKDQDIDKGEAEYLQDELAELFGDNTVFEEADPEADRETAHQIITALAAAFPLPASSATASPSPRERAAEAPDLSGLRSCHPGPPGSHGPPSRGDAPNELTPGRAHHEGVPPPGGQFVNACQRLHRTSRPAIAAATASPPEGRQPAARANGLIHAMRWMCSPTG